MEQWEEKFNEWWNARLNAEPFNKNNPQHAIAKAAWMEAWHQGFEAAEWATMPTGG